MPSRCVVVLCAASLMLSAGSATAASPAYYFQDLGAIDGLNSGWEGLGYAINGAGQVTGITGSGGSGDAAFLYSSGTASLLAGGSGGYGYGINSAGAVAGYVNTVVFPNPAEQGAAMWTSGGVMNFIGLLPGRDVLRHELRLCDQQHQPGGW